MNTKGFALLGLLALFVLSGCDGNKQNESVVSQRYIHKYGYAVSEEEWETRHCPGQMITSLDNGVTITATYEEGIKHGPTTETFPHSQTVEHYALYNRGNKVKEISYDLTGTPIEEWIQLSPTRYSITQWYASGSPMMVEEFVGEELLDGQYFTTSNEVESRVEKGAGVRVQRERDGSLLAKESFEGGYATKKETFYASGALESSAFYFQDNLHGQRRVFAQNGEPLAIEEWLNGQIHGQATYFKNGNRYVETSYIDGQKNGIERHFIDGDIVSQEIMWLNDQKHGLSLFYADGKPEQQWFYSSEPVSKRKFDEMNRIDQLISNLPYSEENRHR